MTDRARLVLVTPRIASDATAAHDLQSWTGTLLAALGSAFEGGPVDAVLIHLPDVDERSLVKAVKPVVGLGQDKGAAMLLVDAAGIVARAGADGVHVSQPDGLAAALETLKPHERIVGAGGARARHDAMEAAEAGCDYVLFGEPDATGSLPPFPAVLERVSWWAEVFETPCIGYAPRLEDVGAMAATGCEFVALGEAAFGDGSVPAEAVRRALAAIADAPVPLR